MCVFLPPPAHPVSASPQINKQDPVELRSILEKCAGTSLNSKLIHQQKDFFAKMVVEAVMSLDPLLPLDMIGIKKVTGGALEVSVHVIYLSQNLT